MFRVYFWRIFRVWQGTQKSVFDFINNRTSLFDHQLSVFAWWFKISLQQRYQINICVYLSDLVKYCFSFLFIMDVISMFIKFWLGSVKIIRCLGRKLRVVELIRMMKIWFLAKYFQSKRGDVITTTAPLLNLFFFAGTKIRQSRKIKRNETFKVKRVILGEWITVEQVINKKCDI